MGRAAKHLPALVAALLLVLLVGAQTRWPEAFATVRHRLFDAYMAAHPARPQALVTLIDIDEESLARHGPWPWPGGTLAELVARVGAAGAGAVGLALIPIVPDQCPPDPATVAHADPAASVPIDRLGQALAAQGAVVGFALTDRGGTASQPPRRGGVVTIGSTPPALGTRLGASLLPAPGALAGAAGLGALNVFPDPDGRVRRVPLLVQLDEALYPTFASELLRVATGAGSFLIRNDPGDVDGTPLSLKIGPLVTRLDADAELWLHYPKRDAFPSLSAATLMAGTLPPGALAGRIALIGVSALGVGARFASPLGETLTPAEIHAMTLAQVLAGEHPRRPAWALGVEAGIAVAGSMLLILIAFWRRGLWLVLPGLALTGTVLAGGYWLFASYGLLLDASTPSLTIAAVLVTLAFGSYIQTERERRWIHRAFASYVSPNLVSHLMRHPEELRLKGERRECSFVMTDLAGFTPMVERYAPEALVDLLNRYLDGMVAIVFRHQGTVERIIGDAVAVHFSAPVRQADHAQRALDCALAIDAFAQAFSREMQAQGVPFGHTRIGVHSGEVIIGNFGGKHHLDYRSFGDPINTAARLEAANKHFGTRIAVSAATLAQCRGRAMRPIGALLLKGKSQAILTYTPLWPGEQVSGLGEAYTAAYEAVERGDAGGREAFAQCAAAFPDDGLTRFHLERFGGGELGVEILLEK